MRQGGVGGELPLHVHSYPCVYAYRGYVSMHVCACGCVCARTHACVGASVCVVNACKCVIRYRMAKKHRMSCLRMSFSTQSLIIDSSFAKRDLKLMIFYGSSPPCRQGDIQ